jgi:bifunctional non-homologous end joining protein LigD
MSERVVVTVDGRELELSNPDKVLYPEAGFTKGDVIDYYTRIAAVMLPHLRERQVTRIRYPDGVAANGFFEKNASAGTPRLGPDGDVACARLHQAAGDGGVHRLRRPADAGVAGQPRRSGVAHPTVEDRVGRPGQAGGRPRSGPAGRYPGVLQPADQVTAYARRVARELERAEPDLILSRMTRRLRPGKVFIDWSQNNAAKTTITAYSLRGQPLPTVSTPLRWEEVESRTVAPTKLTALVVLKRVERYGDLMAALHAPGPRIPA